MPFTKHDSMIVSEIISAFGVISLFSISIMLFLMYGEMRADNQKVSQKMGEKKQVEMMTSEEKKVALEDLDPQLLTEINNSFMQLDASQQNSNEQIGFFIGKLLEKSFSQEEVTAMQEELSALKKAQAEAATKEEETPASSGEESPVQ